MTIFYPDISSFQAGISLKTALAVACKVTQGFTYVNPDYNRARMNAAANGTFFFAYHFLTQGNAAAQALWCHDHTGSTPLMVDFEPTTGSRPSLIDCLAFIDAYRKLGGVVHLVYLPHWYWQQLGSPSLSALASLGVNLVSSQYTGYGNNGPGWAPYGGMTPIVWQYSDSIRFNGFNVDFNAFKGSGSNDIAKTLAEFKSVVLTGKMPAPPVPKPSTDQSGNPVTGLKVVSRFTQADVRWDAGEGATSYRVKVYSHRPLHRVQKLDTVLTHVTLHDLKAGTRYTVTVLANPASVPYKLGTKKRSSVVFNTEK